MAKWLIKEREDGDRTVEYFNMHTGQSHACGQYKPDIPVAELLKLILERGGPKRLDYILIDPLNGPQKLLQISSETGHA